MDMILPPDLEHYASEAVAKGRFREVADVLVAGVALLKEADAELVTFVQTLDDARSEAERDG